MKSKFNLKFFIITFFILIAVTFYILYAIEAQTQKNDSISINLEEQIAVGSVGSLIESNLNGIVTDLIFTRDSIEDAIDDNDSKFPYDMFYNFSNAKGIYDQIRYINILGDEVIRINYNNGNVESVENENLQNKADRYYVYKTLGLDYDSIYMSKLDLNKENGVVEDPYKPMIRFVTPINNSKGIVVLNYLASNILETVKDYNLSSKGDVYILNQAGYYLYSSEKHEDFAFMLDKENGSFSEMFNSEWNEFDGVGQFETENGLFTYEEFVYEIDSNSEVILDDSSWWIVSHIATSSEYYDLITTNQLKIFLNVLKENSGLIYLILLIAVFISYLVKRNEEHVKKLKYLSEYDELTQIYNRRAGISKIEKIIKEDEEFILMYIDLDGLKKINDNLGHHKGDILIKTFVNIIKVCIRENDIFARVGGDEFILVIPKCNDEACENLWQRILTETERVNNTYELSFLISFSHGITKVKRGTKEEVDSILKRADKKMYEEKQQKKKNKSEK